MRNLIIFGGTFDPIHNGHLQIALQVQKKFHFDKFIFLPCRYPSLKKMPLTTPQQRVDMLTLAIQDFNSTFEVNRLEINREGPSYMVDSLQHFRKQLGANFPITLLLGIDSFLQLPKWHRWKEILKLANLCVIERPGMSITSISEPLSPIFYRAKTEDDALLLHKNSGCIYLYNAGDYDISSTFVRQQLIEGKAVDVIPKKVIAYIKKNHIYLNK